MINSQRVPVRADSIESRKYRSFERTTAIEEKMGLKLFDDDVPRKYSGRRYSRDSRITLPSRSSIGTFPRSPFSDNSFPRSPFDSIHFPRSPFDYDNQRYEIDSPSGNRAIRNTTRKQQVPRFMKKNGLVNIRQDSKEKFERFISDFFTTMVDMDMGLFFFLFIFFYAFSWIVFSFVYWLNAKFRGDLDYYWAFDELDKLQGDMTQCRTNKTACPYDHFVNIDAKTSDDVLIGLGILPKLLVYLRDKGGNLILDIENSNRDVCFKHVTSYATAFLFFIETETTVGYGTRSITENCPESILLLIAQCLLGTMIDAFMVGCIFIKISKPKNRNDTLIFSENAVIAVRDGKYCFMFRIGNLRNSLFVKCVCKVKFIKSKQTVEGEFLPLDQKDMDVGSATNSDKLFLVTPMILKHEINEKSPFWNFSAADLLNEQFEIIVLLEGTVESTGQSSQARTSYLNTEILWGHRFNPILSLGSETKEFSTDYSLFDKTYEVSMPTCSAQFHHITTQNAQKQESFDQQGADGDQPDLSRRPSKRMLKSKIKKFMFARQFANSEESASSGTPSHRASPTKSVKRQSSSSLSCLAEDNGVPEKSREPELYVNEHAASIEPANQPSSRSAKLNKLLSDF